MSTGEKLLFTTQLGSMLRTGLPITEAIEAFVGEKSSGSSLILKKIIDAVKSGQKLSSALQEFPAIFDPVYINVVRSGETTGTLAETLDYLGEQLKKDHELTSRVKSSMIYPIVVMVAMVTVMTFISLFVVPKIVTFAENSGAELPLVTKWIVAVTGIIESYWPFILVGLAGATIAFWQLVKTPDGRRISDSIILKLPIFGPLISRYNQVRFARLLAGFYKYGISVEDSFNILSESLTSYAYQQACIRIKNRLMLGRSLSDAMEGEKELFPSIMSRVIKGAEKTGSLDDTLLKLAQFYETELETALKNLTTIIEPIMIVFLGVGVIGIALSVIVPIYNVTSQLR
jgi:type IV pilus assembly protein PilC